MISNGQECEFLDSLKNYFETRSIKSDNGVILYQITHPFFASDNDSYQIHIVKDSEKGWILTDCAATYMRISFTSEGIDNEVFSKLPIQIIDHCDLEIDNGTIWTKVDLENFAHKYGAMVRCAIELEQLYSLDTELTNSLKYN